MRIFYCCAISIVIAMLFIGCQKLPQGSYKGTYYLTFKDPQDSIHNSMFSYKASVYDISDHYITINGSTLNRDSKKITGIFCVVSSLGEGPFKINIDAKWKKTNGKYRICGSFTTNFNYYQTGDPENPWVVVHGTGTFELAYDSDF
ncbi:MAG: hypothetical protein Q8867_10860 [Bacteroidota bacterium]|nr:hypothetical protein [Bacteroidota bacterium]